MEITLDRVAAFEQHRGEFTVSTDSARLDMDVIHGYLSRAYWCEGLPRETLERAMRGSLCFGLFERDTQVGFVRVVTDHSTFAYVCDVFVLESHQGKGLGTWLMQCCRASRSAGAAPLASDYARCAFAIPQSGLCAIEQARTSHGAIYARHL